MVEYKILGTNELGGVKISINGTPQIVPPSWIQANPSQAPAQDATAREIQRVADAGGGSWSSATGTFYIAPSKNYTPPSGYYIEKDGIKIPVSAGVAEKISRDSSAAAESSQIRPQNINLNLNQGQPANIPGSYDYSGMSQLNRTAAYTPGPRMENIDYSKSPREIIRQLHPDLTEQNLNQIEANMDQPLSNFVFGARYVLGGKGASDIIQLALSPADKRDQLRDQLRTQNAVLNAETAYKSLSGDKLGAFVDLTLEPELTLGTMALSAAGPAILGKIPLPPQTLRMVSTTAGAGSTAYLSITGAADIMESLPELRAGRPSNLGEGVIKIGFAAITGAETIKGIRAVKEIERPVKVSYQENKYIVAQEYKTFDYGSLESGRMQTSYISSANPGDELANALLIQRETAGGVVRTILTSEGYYQLPPKGAVNLGKYNIVSSRSLTLGSGLTGETGSFKTLGLGSQKDLILKFDSSVRPGFTKTTISGIRLEDKPYLKIIRAGDITKVNQILTMSGDASDIINKNLFSNMGIRDMRGLDPVIDLKGGGITTKQALLAEGSHAFKPAPILETLTRQAEIVVIDAAPVKGPFMVYFPSSGIGKTGEAGMLNKFLNGSNGAVSEILKSGSKLKLGYSPRNLQDTNLRSLDKFNQRDLTRDLTAQGQGSAQGQGQGQAMRQAERQAMRELQRSAQGSRQAARVSNFREPPFKFKFDFNDSDNGIDKRILKAERIRMPKDSKKRVKVYVNPRADPIAQRVSQAFYGKATNPKPTKKIKRAFVKEFYGSPAGMVFGKFETKETKKNLRQIIKGGW